jgi:rubredoxin
MTEPGTLPTPENPVTEWHCDDCGVSFTFWTALSQNAPEECPFCGFVFSPNRPAVRMVRAQIPFMESIHGEPKLDLPDAPVHGEPVQGEPKQKGLFDK